MKKIGIVFLLVFCFSDGFSQFKFGVKGGINLSQIITNAGSFSNNYQRSYDTRTGYVFGAWSRFGEKFIFQPELVFSTNAGDLKIFQNGLAQPNTVKLQTTNLDIPLLVGFYMFKKFHILAGPVASIKLAEDKTFAQKISSVTGDASTAFANAAYGYQAGIGVHILGLDFDIRKTGSLSNISNVQFINNSTLNQKYSAWQVTAALKLL